jgi:hypothetical protein
MSPLLLLLYLYHIDLHLSHRACPYTELTRRSSGTWMEVSGHRLSYRPSVPSGTHHREINRQPAEAMGDEKSLIQSLKMNI